MRRILALTLVFALACVVPAGMASATPQDSNPVGGAAGWWSLATDLVDGWVELLVGGSETVEPTSPQVPTDTTAEPDGEADSGATGGSDGEEISGWTPWG